MTPNRTSSSLLIFWLAALGLTNLTANSQTTTGQRGVEEVVTKTAPSATGGHYYALVVGIQNYQHLPKLKTPLSDARDIAANLHDHFQFQTEALLDATRDQILEALDRDRAKLQPGDSLLIYYAGHGYYDQDEQEAYWAPVDAGQDTYAHWIISTEITSRARAIPARHILIVSDSCYAGMLTRDAAPNLLNPVDRAPYLEAALERKSRSVMSSGGNEPVDDCDASATSCEHSVFADAFLEGLRQIQPDRFSGTELFTQFVRVQVAGRSKQLPEYNPIRDSDSQGGDFVFSREPSGVLEAAERTPSPAPPPRITNPENEAVQAALDEYRDAYASMDIRVLKKVWPSLSKEQEKGILAGFRGARAVRVDLRHPAITIAEDTAKVTCDQWMVYTLAGRRQPPQTNSVEILLTRAASGDWRIEDVHARVR